MWKKWTNFWLRPELYVVLQKKLEKAQAQMKCFIDHHRRDVSYTINDWVYVHLRPYCQVFALGTTYHKLSKHFYGPFQILKKIGYVAYKLALPES